MELWPDTIENDHGHEATGFGPADVFLPEKMLQFGAGATFRDLVNVGNATAGIREILNGRVVMVRSTSDSLYIPFKAQDASVSRILSDKTQWPEIMACACNPDLEAIIANKKPVSKDLLKDSIDSCPPFSFPGKLLAILFQRFKHFNGATDKGLLIILTGQTPAKAALLESIVLELAHLNNLDPDVLDWIENSNRFCNHNIL